MITTPTCNFVEGWGSSGGSDSVFLLRFDNLHRHARGSKRSNRLRSPWRGKRWRWFLPNAGSGDGGSATRERRPSANSFTAFADRGC